MSSRLRPLLLVHGQVARSARLARVSNARRRTGVRLLGAFGVLMVACMGVAPRAEAATRSRGARMAALPISIVQTSDSALTLDSNDPTGSGPHAMYVSYTFTNTSGASVPNLSATLGNFTGGVALGGGQPATQYLGTLAAGQTKTLFWFITYSSTIGVRSVLSVNVTDTGAGTASGSGVVRTLSMISSQAGGLTSSASIGAGAVVGQLINLDVAFAFKGWKAGDSFNLQPAGNTNFAGGCFQLVSTVVVSADANLSSVIVPGTANKTFFVAPVASSGGGSTWNAAMRYTFRYMCAGTTATPLPYSNEMSGGQLKYSSNYGTAGAQPGPIPAAPPPASSFTFTKSEASVQLPAGGVETYTIAIRNISTFDVTVDEIRDTLPLGLTYGGVTVASGVTAANSSSMPVAGATGAMVWRGNPGSSYAIAAGATLNLVYTANVTSTAGQYKNSAGALIGTTPIGAGAVTVTVGTADLAVYKTGPLTRAKADTIRYQVLVKNIGPSTAFQLVVLDTLPAGATFVRATNGGTQAAGVVTWPAVASLAVGATIADSVLIVAPNLLTTIVNEGAAASASFDPVAANNNGSADSSRVSTVLTIAVSVLPKGPVAPTRQVPNSLPASPRYWQSYTVSNLSVFSGTYDLIAARSGVPAFLQIDSITGPGITTRVRPDSTQVTLAPNSSSAYRIWYTVPLGDTVTNTEVLRARSTIALGPVDTGWVNLRRSFPALLFNKVVSPTGVLSPGTDLTYTMNFRNTGEYDASAVVVSDKVPAGVYFKLASPSATLPSGITATVAYSNDSGATWAYVPVSGACSAPVGYDGCVNQVRWTLSAVLPPSPTVSSVAFVARIR